MPALPSRIAFVSEEFRSAVWQDANVLALYGKVARNTGDAPIDTYFDNMDDVQAMANERGALLGGHARAFRVEVDQLVDLDGAFAMQSALPGARLIDPELVADLSTAVISVESYDTGAERTTLAVWGLI